MAYYDYVVNKVVYEENLPADYNDAQINAMMASAQIVAQPTNDDDAIAGTRTSNTRFTRSAGTWAVDALIGKFLWSHESGSPETGEFLKIADNGTATVDVDPDYGSGALETTGTAIIILDATTELDAMKLLQQLSVFVKTA